MFKILSKRFEDEVPLFTPVKLANISRNVNKIYGKGFALTGNSGEFLDPVFSSGVAIATESGLKAAKLARLDVEGLEVDWEKEYAQYMQEGISVFSSYVKEWYTGNLQNYFSWYAENWNKRTNLCGFSRLRLE